MAENAIRVSCGQLNSNKMKMDGKDRQGVPKQFMGVVGQISPAIKSIVVSLGYLSELENLHARPEPSTEEDITRRAAMLKVGENHPKRFSDSFDFLTTEVGKDCNTSRDSRSCRVRRNLHHHELNDQISFVPSSTAWSDLLDIDSVPTLEKNLSSLASDLLQACQSGEVSSSDLSTEIKVILTLMTKHQSNLKIIHEGFKLLLHFVLVNPEHNSWLMLLNGGVVVVTRSMDAHASDCGVQMLGCGVLHSLSTSNAHKELVGRDPNVVMFEGLRAVLAAAAAHAAADARLAGLALAALQNMAVNERSAAHAAALGGVSAVLSAMQAHPADPDVQAPACACLLNLAVSGQDMKRLIAGCGGLDLVLAALARHPADAAVAAPACAALHSLATRSPANKARAGAAGAVGLLLAALAAHPDDPAVARPAVWALQTLSADCPDNAARLAPAGAGPAALLAVAAHAGAGDVVRPACWALDSLLAAAGPAAARALSEDPACGPALAVLRRLPRCGSGGGGVPSPDDELVRSLLRRLDPAAAAESEAELAASEAELAAAKPAVTSVFL